MLSTKLIKILATYEDKLVSTTKMDKDLKEADRDIENTRKELERIRVAAVRENKDLKTDVTYQKAEKANLRAIINYQTVLKNHQAIYQTANTYIQINRHLRDYIATQFERGISKEHPNLAEFFLKHSANKILFEHAEPDRKFDGLIDNILMGVLGKALHVADEKDKAFHFANCWEQSCIAFSSLLTPELLNQNRIRRIETVGMREHDHDFVIINLDPDKKVTDDPKNWGSEAILFDLWNGEILSNEHKQISKETIANLRNILPDEIKLHSHVKLTVHEETPLTQDQYQIIIEFLTAFKNDLRSLFNELIPILNHEIPGIDKPFYEKLIKEITKSIELEIDYFKTCANQFSKEQNSCSYCLFSCSSKQSREGATPSPATIADAASSIRDEKKGLTTHRKAQ